MGRWTFARRGWSLDHRVSYVQERTAYMLAFGMSSSDIPQYCTSRAKLILQA